MRPLIRAGWMLFGMAIAIGFAWALDSQWTALIILAVGMAGLWYDQRQTALPNTK